MQRRLLRPLMMFAVSGRGEAQRVPGWECQGAGELPCGRMLWLDRAPAQPSPRCHLGMEHPDLACWVLTGPVPSHPVLRDRTGSPGEKRAAFCAPAPPQPAVRCRRPLPEVWGCARWRSSGKARACGTACVWDLTGKIHLVSQSTCPLD